jgi:hypothetical protein
MGPYEHGGAAVKIPVLGIILGLLAAMFIGGVRAHDPDHPELNQWYASVKQPDTGISCCGPSDAYWCNEGAKGSQVTCTIDDNRSDKRLSRRHVPNGTVVNIPQHKINKDPNPTGSAVVWLSPADYVWCFVGISGS